MYPAIRLYARTLCQWSCKTEQIAIKELNEFLKKNIKHEIQCWKGLISKSKRKLKPFSVEVSYYDSQSIRQILENELRDAE